MSALALTGPGPLLQTVLQELGFDDEGLLDATEDPRGTPQTRDWLDRGDWLSLAKQVGVCKIFFVNNDPAVVFAEFPPLDGEQKREAFNQIWCMARPRLLFMGSPGEVEVFDLAHRPVRRNEPLAGPRLLGAVKDLIGIREHLMAFHRKRIESGVLFENEKMFGKAEDRADAALIRNLRVTRERLVSTAPGLKTKFAHAIIGRSIFVRYLEDREILVPKYFYDVAETDRSGDWKRLLDAPTAPDVDPALAQSLYLKVLSDKAFTYALFSQIAHDFRGDIFPSNAEEQGAVHPDHLRLLQRFLRGDQEDQPNLFFFAYRFKVIPIDLISSIYEEFYHVTVGKENKGSHYTPSTLVSFLLSRVLTEDCLDGMPRVLDPATGSGIFLVEAFRRMVRHRARKLGRPLDQTELLDILAKQIAGIEINPEAVRVAAFSLYLALLHYQEPPDIQQKKRLPFLVFSPAPLGSTSENSDGPGSGAHLDILLEANAFAVENSVADPKRLAKLRRQFGPRCADVMVGNPPWGNLNGFKRGEQDAERDAAVLALDWCKEKNLSVGDTEQSQAFIHLAIHLLRAEGTAGLLVSSGVLLKRGRKSRLFRQQWLEQTTLCHVVNFSHVRKVFFSQGIAPFASVIFRCQAPPLRGGFQYWSAKETAIVQKTKAVVLRKPDLHVLDQREVLADDRLWKIYWWGDRGDEALIRRLDMELTLTEQERLVFASGSGFKAGSTQSDTEPQTSEEESLPGEDADETTGDTPEEDGKMLGRAQADESHHWIQEYEEVPTKLIQRYGPLTTTRRSLPPSLERVRTPELYQGLRLLMNHGPSQRNGALGQIIARLETAKFAVRHSVYVVRFHNKCEDAAKVVLGILWSSLARYYLFLTASSWGTWHNKISLAELRGLPIRLPEDQTQINTITSLVDQLRKSGPKPARRRKPVPNQQEFQAEGFDSKQIKNVPLDSNVQVLEDKLDDAIFELYGLNPAEKDQVLDLCRYGLPLYYLPDKSEAVETIDPSHLPSRQGWCEDITWAMPSVISTKVKSENSAQVIGSYLRAYLSVWQSYLEPDGFDIIWEVLAPESGSPMIGVAFTTQEKRIKTLPPASHAHDKDWKDVLTRFAQLSHEAVGTHKIFLEAAVRLVSEREVLIIKRNIRRLWTPTAAREDANATLAQVLRRNIGAAPSASKGNPAPEEPFRGVRPDV